MSTPAEAEATQETTTFEHFGKTWTVPAKQRLSHMVKFRNELAQSHNVDLAMCAGYLTNEQFSDLLAIDPDADALDAFTDDMARALGFKTSGNS